jgi:adenylosuccinate synthase
MRLDVIVGGQYGSEGKGAIAAFLARNYTSSDLAIRVAGPNAGHTAYDEQGREWKLRAVPVAAVTSRSCNLHIAAGSEIDMEVLRSELAELDAAGHNATERLTVHPSATIIEYQHKADEQAASLVQRIGSTGKGIGAARAARIMRTAMTYGDLSFDQTLPAASTYTPNYAGHSRVMIEGTQGYGLGLHTANYPQVTSSDCRAIDFMAMVGISPWTPGVHTNVIVVARVYPIRVAGNSGPLKGETSWAKLGLPEERTTVTNKVRRVGEQDYELIRSAVKANGGPHGCTIALTMLDQKVPEVRDNRDVGGWPQAALDEINKVSQLAGAPVSFVGVGPRSVVVL